MFPSSLSTAFSLLFVTVPFLNLPYHPPPGSPTSSFLPPLYPYRAVRGRVTVKLQSKLPKTTQHASCPTSYSSHLAPLSLLTSPCSPSANSPLLPHYCILDPGAHKAHCCPRTFALVVPSVSSALPLWAQLLFQPSASAVPLQRAFSLLFNITNPHELCWLLSLHIYDLNSHTGKQASGSHGKRDDIISPV